jgi:integrase
MAPAQKTAALTDDIRAMIDAKDAGIIGARDRALILLGFAGAFRRSELVRLDVEDCAFGKDGLTLTLRRSKIDQAGEGRKIGIPYGSNPETCPVRTIQAWVEQAGVTAGPLFRSINRPRARPGRPPQRYRRGACHQETGSERGPRSCQVRGALASRRTCHCRGDRGRLRAVHHEADRASVGSDGAEIYPGR